MLLAGLLGTVAFAFFCFYLLLAVIAGAMMLGLRLVFITIHPMKYGVPVTTFVCFLFLFKNLLAADQLEMHQKLSSLFLVIDN